MALTVPVASGSSDLLDRRRAPGTVESLHEVVGQVVYVLEPDRDSDQIGAWSSVCHHGAVGERRRMLDQKDVTEGRPALAIDS